LDRLLERNVVLQVFAVLLAVVLWFLATADQNPEEQFTFDAVPVSARDAPEGLTITGAPRPAKVNIKITCRRRVADKLDSSDFEAFVSLAGGNEGTYDYPVEVGLPDNVELVEINPATVSVTLEETVAIDVPVEVTLTGPGPEGYTIGEITVDPEKVIVRGPASVVARVRHAAAGFDPSGATSRTSRTVSIAAVDADGSAVSGVDLAPSQVTVTIDVAAEAAEDIALTLNDLPLSVRNTPADLEAGLSPEKVDLVLRGPRGLLERFQASDVAVWVDAAGLGAGAYLVAVTVELPEWAEGDVEIQSYSPSEVTLTLDP